MFNILLLCIKTAIFVHSLYEKTNIELSTVKENTFLCLSRMCMHIVQFSYSPTLNYLTFFFLAYPVGHHQVKALHRELFIQSSKPLYNMSG